MKLVFGKANSKLIRLQERIGRKIYTFSTLSGVNCPGAKDCLAYAVETPDGMRIKDGPHSQFRCFSASQEILFPSVYNARKSNMGLIALAGQSIDKAVELFLSQFPKDCKVLRWHVAGDWKTLNYFKMGLEIARLRPDVVFYCYTKSVHFWVKELGNIPSNFRLTASLGGKYDAIALSNGLPYAKVVFSTLEAKQLGLKLDKDDYLAYKNKGSFGLLLHGSQPINSPASIAWQKIKRNEGGYSKKRNKLERAV